MRIAIIANRDESDAGLVLAALASENPVVSILYREEPRSWPSTSGADLVVSLGSSWSVYWDQVSTNVDAEAAFLRHSIGRGVPYLGICFGAQMLSSAFGGRVERGRKAEIGWHDVIATDVELPLGGRWMQWHYDCFSAPVGFDTLAFNDAGVQAIRRGRSLGVQFHPEANEATVTRWMEGEGAAELAAVGLSPQKLLDETRHEVMRTEGATAELVRWFLETIAQGPVLA
jgi:GMP synthase-like glutamine amidotransferase